MREDFDLVIVNQDLLLFLVVEHKGEIVILDRFTSIHDELEVLAKFLVFWPILFL